MRRQGFIWAFALVLVVSPFLASAGATEAVDRPIDIRPVMVIKKRVAKSQAPLPRLRPYHAPKPDDAAAREGTPEELVGVAPSSDVPSLAKQAAIDLPVSEISLAAAVLPVAAAGPAAGAEPPVREPPRPAVEKLPARPSGSSPPLLEPRAMDLPDDPAAPFSTKPDTTRPVLKPDRMPLRLTVPAIEPSVQPYQLLRTLQLLQDQIAQGSVSALVKQRDLRGRMDTEFENAAPAVWQDKRNAAAAVTYVLSGGAPSVLLTLQGSSPPAAIDRRLIDGALAYSAGKEEEANQQLGQIDAFSLPPSMGAQVALAQSALAVRGDPEKAMKLLDAARLLAPGTLVEEAALRRQIFVADQMRNVDRVQALARQYLERFRHSVYAGNFRNRFASAVSHLNLAENVDQAQRLDDILATVEPAARCQLYLTFALAAVIKGNVAAGALASERAAALAEPGSLDESRARLYSAAARAADPKSLDQAMADLGKVGKDGVSPSDRTLYEMVATTIAGVKGGTERPSQTPSAKAGELTVDDVDLKPLFARAGDSIKAADTLLAAAE